MLRPGGLLLVTVTRWTQHRHSYWTFRLMEDNVRERLAEDDRWTCFEHTPKNKHSLLRLAASLGFRLNDMTIPDGSHWTPEARDEIAKALTPSGGCPRVALRT